MAPWQEHVGREDGTNWVAWLFKGPWNSNAPMWLLWILLGETDSQWGRSLPGFIKLRADWNTKTSSFLVIFRYECSVVIHIIQTVRIYFSKVHWKVEAEWIKLRYREAGEQNPTVLLLTPPRLQGISGAAYRELKSRKSVQISFETILMMVELLIQKS